MTGQTDAAEVETLAAVLSDIDNQPRMGTYPRQALALLSSDWLVAREAAARAEALREAADEITSNLLISTRDAGHAADWLRDRADSIARTDGAGS